MSSPDRRKRTARRPLLKPVGRSTATPKFEKYGPVQAEVRVKIGSQSFTNNALEFNFFSVTDSTKTVAFGPGLLKHNVLNYSTVFVIQAKDKASNDRVCGMDKFKISIKYKDKDKSKDGEGCTIPHKITDSGDGTHIVEYIPKQAGEYHIHIEFAGTFQGRAGSIWGSPFIAKATEGMDSEPNSLGGKMLKESIFDSIDDLKTLACTTSKGLTKNVAQDDINSLVAIKDHLRNIVDTQDSNECKLSSNRSALMYMKREGMKFP